MKKESFMITWDFDFEGVDDGFSRAVLAHWTSGFHTKSCRFGAFNRVNVQGKKLRSRHHKLLTRMTSLFFFINENYDFLYI